MWLICFVDVWKVYVIHILSLSHSLYLSFTFIFTSHFIPKFIWPNKKYICFSRKFLNAMWIQLIFWIYLISWTSETINKEKEIRGMLCRKCKSGNCCKLLVLVSAANLKNILFCVKSVCQILPCFQGQNRLCFEHL